MQASEFKRLTQGRSDASWCAYFDVGAATFRRWKTGKARVPGAVARLLRMGCSELSALAGAGDEWRDFSFGPDGRFYHPFWREGFSAGDLRGMFFLTQDAWQDKRDLRATLAENAELKKQVEFYRKQCSTESRFGLIWARVMG